MRRYTALAALTGAWLVTASVASADELPGWAYPLDAPASAAVVDLHPEDHPAMPDIVKTGRAGVPACASCHQANGAGRPDNAALAGLNETYIKQQLRNFRRGVRRGSEPRRAEQAMMGTLAANLSDAEVNDAAKYFASLKPASSVKVVETDTVPKATDGGTEPIGKRIVEVPEDSNAVSKAQFVAYVPKGSIAKGEALVTNGDGKTVQCMSCHGAGLQGSGDVPRLAGQSPSYLVRQLYDLQQGKRSGAIAPMQPVVDGLDVDDMIAIAAYAASLQWGDVRP